MASQTHREIINELLRKGGRPIRVGCHENFWWDALRQWVKEEGYPTKPDGSPADALEIFDLDDENVGGWFDILPLKGVSELVEETSEWTVKRNGAGAALKYWKDKSGTPEHVDFRMTSREVWDRDYRPHLLSLDRSRLNIEQTRHWLTVRRAEGRWCYYGHLFVWENMRQSMGDICLYESLLTDPDWIHDYCRVYTDFFKMHFAALMDPETGAGRPDGIFLFEDLGYRNGLFASPKLLGELIFPYYRELVEFFHAQGLPVLFHSCGCVRDALPLIVEAGFDAINPIEAKANNDLFRYAEQYGDKLAFIGGLDARVLETGDQEAIRSAVRAVVTGMKSRGARYMFGSDHSVSTRVRYRDYAAALAAYRMCAEY